LGLTEKTDAVVVVVSEETGNISVCMTGEITSKISSADLKEFLTREF
jgi:diadenylate cyclase